MWFEISIIEQKENIYCTFEAKRELLFAYL